ncbi:unnamed protein product [Prunus armeniaca]|nr:hypothetical protein GBA52_020971 [Prunus armeniaca]CAB4282778.1 unnamed protein product [Prunus armeniaca]
MSICRVDSMCKKYDKYDIEKQQRHHRNPYGDDAFPRLCARVNYKILSRSSGLVESLLFFILLFLFGCRENVGTERKGKQKGSSVWCLVFDCVLKCAESREG